MSLSKFATKWRVHSPEDIPWCGSVGDIAKLAPIVPTLLDLSGLRLVAKNEWHLLFPIYLSVEIESLYF